MSAVQAAIEWRLRLAEGPLSSEESEAFEAWLAADPANPAAFDAAAAVWEETGEQSDLPDMVMLRGAALESARRARASRWRRGPPARLAAIAATLVLAVFAGVWAFGAPQVYRTGVGERELVVLSDGSRLSLDADTAVLVRYSGQRRHLDLLRGRARFAVAKDPLKPFTVSAAGKTVVAVGTEFSVERLGGQVRVVLYEGKISVLKASAPVPVGPARQPADAVLRPGAELVIDRDARVAQLASVDLSRAISWEAGQLVFDDEPLARAVERVNRYSNEKIEVADDRAADVLVSGVFTAGDTAAFVDGVADIFPIDASTNGERIVLAYSPNRR